MNVTADDNQSLEKKKKKKRDKGGAVIPVDDVRSNKWRQETAKKGGRGAGDYCDRGGVKRTEITGKDHVLGRTRRGELRLLRRARPQNHEH